MTARLVIYWLNLVEERRFNDRFVICQVDDHESYSARNEHFCNFSRIVLFHDTSSVIRNSSNATLVTCMCRYMRAFLCVCVNGAEGQINLACKVQK